MSGYNKAEMCEENEQEKMNDSDSDYDSDAEEPPEEGVPIGDMPWIEDFERWSKTQTAHLNRPSYAVQIHS
jgi:hypothetical protein